MSDTTPRPLDLTGRIIEFESGGLGPGGIVSLFVDLLNTGLAWQLQGSYGRLAQQLLDNRHIRKDDSGAYVGVLESLP